MAFRQLVDDLHQHLAERGWSDVRESYGFVLLAIGDDATTTTELADLLGVTKQAMSKLLDAMEAAGFVRRGADERDGRVKAVTLAPRGRRLLAEVEDIYEQLEGDWASVIGERRVGQVRTGIERVLRSRHDGELPRLRPT
jgi:DNA-binding MarR family transcriptional regulator